MAGSKKRHPAAFKAKVALEAVKQTKIAAELAKAFPIHPVPITLLSGSWGQVLARRPRPPPTECALMRRQHPASRPEWPARIVASRSVRGRWPRGEPLPPRSDSSPRGLSTRDRFVAHVRAVFHPVLRSLRCGPERTSARPARPHGTAPSLGFPRARGPSYTLPRNLVQRCSAGITSRSR
jgi:hypothetical protein